MRKEPKHTCPDIDGLIKTLKEIEARLLSCNNRDSEDDLVCIAHSAARDINEIYSWRGSVLEDLRSSNEDIRNWGREMSELAEVAESKLDEVSYKLSEAEDKIDQLLDQIDELQQELSGVYNQKT